MLGDSNRDRNDEKEEKAATGEQHVVLQVGEDTIATGKDLEVVADRLISLGGTTIQEYINVSPTR